MGEINNEILMPEMEGEFGRESFNNFRSLKIGQGDKIIVTDKEGTRWGHHKFSQANAYVKINGDAGFNSVVVKNASGSTLIDSNSLTQDYVHVLNTKLNTDSQEILKDFDFGSDDYAGAVKAGTIAWNTSTGVVIGGSGVVVNRAGIVGAKAGVTTFSIATNGDATFKGTVTAGSVLAAGDIASGGTITGVNIVSSSGNDSIRLTNGDVLEFYLSGVMKGTIQSELGGDIVIAGTDDVTFSAGGSIRCGVHGNEFRPHANGTYELGSASYKWEKVHSDEYDVGSNWKITESGDQLLFKYGTTEYMRLNGNKIRPAGTYEASDGSDGEDRNDTMVTWIWEDSNDLKFSYRDMVWKDGILTGSAAGGNEKVCSSCV